MSAAVQSQTAAPAAAAGPGAGVQRDDDRLATLVGELRAELRSLGERITALEKRQPPAAAAATAPVAAAAGAAGAAGAGAGAAAPAAASAPRAASPPVTEDDMVAIAAAVAAFLGVKAQIRQVRLIQSSAWAQVGRATIHASHRL